VALSSIEVFQERTNIPGTGHKVESTVTAAVLIPKELFVFKQSDDTFLNVATVRDLSFPVGNTLGFTAFRADTVTREFTDINTAIEFAGDVKRRLELVVDAFDQDAADFAGSETTDIP